MGAIKNFILQHKIRATLRRLEYLDLEYRAQRADIQEELQKLYARQIDRVVQRINDRNHHA
jgi:hypothetical protein